MANFESFNGSSMRMVLPNDEYRMNDDFLPTETSELQARTEESVSEWIECGKENDENCSKLDIFKHSKFIKKAFKGLSDHFVGLDASRPWILYWTLHSLELMNIPISLMDKQRAIAQLKQYQNVNGGFGGGFGQVSHLAPTYAAIHTIAILRIPEAYDIINVPELYQWLLSLKQPDGSFVMHVGGEVDVRGSYCALSVARLVGVLDDKLAENVASFIVSCQTYEGGIGAIPGAEAHGGYTFCGLAAMSILKSTHLLRMDRLMKWACFRQLQFEGGFQGRTNKLVDGCYSYWLAALFPIIGENLGIQNELFNFRRLKEYVYWCCQDDDGGLRDKPGKSPDFYHTCYCLSGLSVYGDEKLIRTDPVHNTSLQNVEKMLQYFKV